MGVNDHPTRPYDFSSGEHPTDELDVTRAVPETSEYAYDRHVVDREPEPSRRGPIAEVPAGGAYAAGRAPVPAPAPLPAPAVAPAPAAYPMGGAYAAPVSYHDPGRGPGAGGLARFVALALCLILTGCACVLFVLGVVSAVVETQTALYSGESAGSPVTAQILIGCAVLAAFLATLTAGWSGLGVTISGVLLLVGGGATMLFPQLLAGIIGQALEAGQVSTGSGIIDDFIGGAVDDVVASFIGAVSALLAAGSVMLGAVQLAAGLGARAARRAGWRRGTGR